ncbi:MAG TPA: Ig-like domain-containing protein [Gemmatimonadales bacterium]|nr:Ig-like domain-containing protein [Gemmatimonadales bacterium]
MMRIVAAAVLVALIACAKIEPPPGGPPDQAPPFLVAVTPDTMASLPGFDGEVEFRFNEVISEGSSPNRGTGTGDLERLVLLSPTDRVPDVSWKRNRITVRPREGWRPNTVYRVELLPGVMDLRNNRATSLSRTLTFTTGGETPHDTLAVRVYDWTTGRPAARALVEAFLLPDSLRYRFSTDSAGRLLAAPLPAGQFVVYGVIDANSNSLREEREAFDSATVATGADSLELWTFAHDTVPPRVREALPRDSVTVAVQFSQPLHPSVRFTTESVSVWRLADSSALEVVWLLREAEADSMLRAAQDSAAVPADSAVAAPQVKPGAQPGAPTARTPSRPPLSDRVLLRLAAPMDSAGRYGFSIRGVRNVTGVSASVDGRFVAPEPRAILVTPVDTLLQPDSLRAVPDSLRVPQDTLPRRVDTLPRRP